MNVEISPAGDEAIDERCLGSSQITLRRNESRIVRRGDAEVEQEVIGAAQYADAEREPRESWNERGNTDVRANQERRRQAAVDMGGGGAAGRATRGKRIQAGEHDVPLEGLS